MKIVAFEGSDYSGKTTTAKILADRWHGMTYNMGNIFAREEENNLKFDNEIQREAYYTANFMLDKNRMTKNDRIILQDRYWMSVVAYGRFLNGVNSIHHNVDMSNWMIKPDIVVYLSCSIPEKIRRSEIRGVRSVLDNYLLSNPSRIKDLEFEIAKTIMPFSKVLKVDTTNKSKDEVANIVENYLEEFL